MFLEAWRGAHGVQGREHCCGIDAPNSCRLAALRAAVYSGVLGRDFAVRPEAVDEDPGPPGRAPLACVRFLVVAAAAVAPERVYGSDSAQPPP